jgi:hypothetical protein
LSEKGCQKIAPDAKIVVPNAGNAAPYVSSKVDVYENILCSMLKTFLRLKFQELNKL